jgi:hypothetical protein
MVYDRTLPRHRGHHHPDDQQEAVLKVMDGILNAHSQA